MKKTSNHLRNVLSGVCALAAANSASALDILLTNDDGWDKPGIQTVRTALCDAGHTVTLVGPAVNQSGRGGSFNTGAFSSSSAMALTKHASDACGDVFSLAGPTAPGRFGGTPVDAMKAGLQVVMAGKRPDLIVSGNNEGQNLGKPTSNGSGTVGAALQGAFEGIPAIAGSVGVIFTENPLYPSTEASYEPAAEFLVDLIDVLHQRFGAEMFPKKVRLLNVNFPVPYNEIKGVKLTNLADRSEINLPLYDRNAGFAPLPPIAALPSCATLSVGGSCSVGVAFQSITGPDKVRDADTDAHAAGYISITPMDGDMTATTGTGALTNLIKHLAP